ncbi:MAG: hypothetical protein HYX71_07065 [Opitutae bacterium]|nr:hypothetical protein [Opitutae bacterium]
MQEEIITGLRQRRAQIRARWEALLRIEKVTTPLANPDTMVFGLEHSLDEIFAALRQPPPAKSSPGAILAESPSPWQAYFRAGEQALLESLVLLQAEMKLLDPATRDTTFGVLKQVIHNLTQREVRAWEAIRRKSARPRPPRAPGRSSAAPARRHPARTPTRT